MDLDPFMSLLGLDAHSCAMASRWSETQLDPAMCLRLGPGPAMVLT